MTSLFAIRFPAPPAPLLLVLCLAAACGAFGPDRPDEPVKIWITLKDKGPAQTAPHASRAFEDLPLHRPYLEALAAAGATIGVSLKWQNRVSAFAARSRLPALRALPFVAALDGFRRKAPLPAVPPFGPWISRGLAKRAAGDPGYGASRALLDSMGVIRVHRWMASRGMSPGRGVRMAVIDADFHLGHRTFRPLFEEGRIQDEFDFVDSAFGAVSEALDESHGAQVLSLIAGNQPDTLMGVAPWADFLLYRAEDGSQERYVEEDFVAAAIERAVENGAKVISISLGYRDGFTDGSPDYPHAWMDGRTRPSSLAALGAARRDAVVVASVGNMEPDEAPAAATLGAPADADSILAVGIVDSRRIRCDYSATGPTSDGRVKPDIAAMGPVSGCQIYVANTASPAFVFSGTGTSYAAPVIAGIAALIRQARPGLDAQGVRQAILSSGHRAGSPDSRVGYGMADAWAALHGPGSVPPPPGGRLARVYHGGGRDPLSVAWITGEAAAEVLVVDARGRRVEVTQRNSGARLLLEPAGDLRTGVSFVRIKPFPAH